MPQRLSNVKLPAFHAHTHWDKHAPTAMLWVRHGETDWNVDRRIQGWKGTGLNKLGFAQAGELARRIRALGLKADLVLTSDLLRAKQTARAIAKALKLPLRVWPELRERGFGEWEGKRIEEVLADFKLGPKTRKDPFLSFDPKRGESMTVFGRRTERALRRMERQLKGKTIVVVSHGGPMRIAACIACGIPLNKYFLLGRPGNTAISLIQSQGGTRWVESYNDTAHLEAKRAPRKRAR